MERIVVLGGGVGGTLAANLLARRLRRQIGAGEVELTLIDEGGEHVYQPGFMYIAMGGERAERLHRPERSLLNDRIKLVIARVKRIDHAARQVEVEGGQSIGYDWLIIATGARALPDEIPHFTEEAHHFYGADAAARLRAALDPDAQEAP